MNIDDYAEWALAGWYGPNEVANQFPTLKDKYIMSCGLGGETGEVLELLKKSVRDDKLNLHDLKLELGDMIYYWCVICKANGLQPSEVLNANILKLTERRLLKKLGK